VALCICGVGKDQVEPTASWIKLNPQLHGVDETHCFVSGRTDGVDARKLVGRGGGSVCASL
jgi:hypothetical protein